MKEVYENDLHIIYVDNEKELGKLVASEIIEEVIKKPDTVLGLATGSSPIPVYKELSKLYGDKAVDFSKVRTFNLDEYVGISYDNENSYHKFMYDNLFDNINMDEENINIPDPKSEDEKELKEICRKYDEKIKELGIDLQILGMGVNGHIAFNEPNNVRANTSIVKLKEETIKANARFFEDEKDVPRYAMSMGLKQILSSKKIIAIISGKSKKDAFERLLKQETVTDEFPISFLKLHNNTKIYVLI